MASNTKECECGMVLNSINKGGIASHLKSKTHQLRLKYPEKVVSNKIECDICHILVEIMKYENHLETQDHKLNLERICKNDLICECGIEIELKSETAMRDHYRSKSHKHAIMLKEAGMKEKDYFEFKKQEKMNRKLQEKEKNYNENKDSCNCCKRCFACNIPQKYYNPDQRLCVCCVEILQGGTKICTMCEDEKDINSFERPYLIRCRKCAGMRLKEKYLCKCGKSVSITNMAKHNKSQKHIEAIEELY